MPPATDARTPPSGSDPARLELGTLTLQSGCLLFTCLPALARTSRTLNRSSESLIGGRKRCLSPLRVRFAVVFCRCPLQGEVVLFHSSFVECFYHEEMVDFVQCFFFPERHLLLKCPRQGTLGNLAPAVSRGCGHGVVFCFFGTRDLSEGCTSQRPLTDRLFLGLNLFSSSVVQRHVGLCVPGPTNPGPNPLH